MHCRSLKAAAEEQKSPFWGPFFLLGCGFTCHRGECWSRLWAAFICRLSRCVCVWGISAVVGVVSVLDTQLMGVLYPPCAHGWHTGIISFCGDYGEYRLLSTCLASVFKMTVFFESSGGFAWDLGRSKGCSPEITSTSLKTNNELPIYYDRRKQLLNPFRIK